MLLHMLAVGAMLLRPAEVAPCRQEHFAEPQTNMSAALRSKCCAGAALQAAACQACLERLSYMSGAEERPAV